MFVKWFLITCVLCLSEFECSPSAYVFSDLANGWLKLHSMPAEWTEAKVHCDTEDAVLASPITSALRNAIIQFLLQKQGNSISLTIFTGFQANYDKGDFLSIEGHHLSDLHVALNQSTHLNYQGTESCISWDTGKDKLKKERCDRRLPYVCYKKITSGLTVPSTTNLHDSGLKPNPSSPIVVTTNQRTNPREELVKCVADGNYLVVIKSEQQSSILENLAENLSNKITIMFTDNLEITLQQDPRIKPANDAPNIGNGTPYHANGTPNTRNRAPNPVYGAPNTGLGTPYHANRTTNTGNGIPYHANGTPNTGHRVSNLANGAPNTGNRAPNPANGTPNAGNKAPNPVYGTPNTGYRVPNLANGVPNTGNRAPNPTNGAPNTGYRVPNPANGIPNAGYRVPNPANGAPSTENGTPNTGIRTVTWSGKPGRILDYTLVKDAGGWLKIHEPATWSEARDRCNFEGGVLVSPLTSELRDGIKQYVLAVNPSVSTIYIGVHANFNSGDYISIEGVFLTKMPVSLDHNVIINYQSSDSCLTMTTDTTQHTESTQVQPTKCTDKLPYVCYKKEHAVTACGTLDPEYKYEARTESCYKFHRKGETWSKAYTKCNEEGGYLAIINSQAESVVLKQLFAKNPKNVINGYYNYMVYLGARDWLDGNTWTTVLGQSLKQVGYLKWASTEPNNARKDENCLSFNRSGMMYDDPCDLNLAFICEKNPEILVGEPHRNQW